jgi:hypothetical protein
MLEDGIHPSLRGSVDFFVDFGGIPTRGQGSKHVGIFIGTGFYFRFNEINLEMRLGPHGKFDGIFGFVWGCHTHKED